MEAFLIGVKLNSHFITLKVLAWESFSAMIGKPMNQVSVKMTDVQLLRFTPIYESCSVSFKFT